jgi:hypothetical protein
MLMTDGTNVQVCDATEDDGDSEAGNIKIISLTFWEESFFKQKL